MYEVVYNFRGFSIKKYPLTRERFATLPQAKAFVRQLHESYSLERKYILEDVRIINIKTGDTLHLL